MNFLGILFGVMVLIVVFVVWLKYYKQIKGDAGEMAFGSPIKMRKGDPASLEEFVAAYRRGEVPASTRTTPTSATANIPAAPAHASVPYAPPQVRNPFLSAEVKLAYLLCRTGLRDHHVFPNLPLSALCTHGNVEVSLSRAAIDLLICNPQMTPVAAIDIVGAQPLLPETAKVEFLKSLGVRYLRLSAKSLPKADALHGLLYKM
ncbi:MAG: hypothetical protein ABL878_09635 [Burkholderiales bacterium]